MTGIFKFLLQFKEPETRNCRWGYMDMVQEESGFRFTERPWLDTKRCTSKCVVNV